MADDSLINKTESVYNSLTDKGKHYMSGLLSLGAVDSKQLQHVLSLRDKARKQHTLESLQDRLNGSDRIMNRTIRNDNVGVSDNDCQRVDEFIQRPAILSALAQSKNDLYQDFNKKHPMPHLLSTFPDDQPQRDAAQQGIDMYKNMSEQGRRYFNANLHEAKYGKKQFSHVKHGGEKMTNYEKKARNRLKNMALGTVQHGSRFVQKYKSVPVDEKDKVDKFFDKPAAMNAIKYGLIQNKMEQYNDAQRIKATVQQKPAENVKQNIKVGNLGKNIYSGLSPQGRKLFRANLRQAAYNPDRFHTFKTTDIGDMNPRQWKTVSYFDGLKNGYTTGRDGKPHIIGKRVPGKEAEQIDDYFKDDKVTPIIKNGLLVDKIHALDNSEMNQLGKKAAKSAKVKDYLHTNPDLYRQMLIRGGKMYNKLTPRGRKYMLAGAKLGSYNLNDFDKAMKDDPSTLTPPQRRIHDRMERFSGRTISKNDGRSMALKPDAMSVDEKDLVDKYLNNDITRDGMHNGSVYDELLAQNIRERNLAETRQDENSGAGRVFAARIRRQSPIAFAIGYKLASHHYAKHPKAVKRMVAKDQQKAIKKTRKMQRKQQKKVNPAEYRKKHIKRLRKYIKDSTLHDQKKFRKTMNFNRAHQSHDHGPEL